MGLNGASGGITEFWFPPLRGVPNNYVLTVVDGALVWQPASGGGGLSSFTSPNATITVGGTLTDPTVDIDLTHANTWSAIQSNTTYFENYSATNWLSGGNDMWIARAGNATGTGLGLFWDSALLGVYLKDDVGSLYPLTVASINVSSLSLPTVGLNQVVANISGELAGDAGFEYDSATNNLLVASASFTPQNKIHIDAGTATASYIQFTAGTTTGQASSDGSQIGISSAGALHIFQREALNIDFFTNSTNNWRITSAGHLIGVSDNNYDIGQSAATRPRHVYVAQNITSGGTVTGAILSATSSAAVTGPVAITRTTLYVSTDGVTQGPAAAATGVTAALIPLQLSLRSRTFANAWDIDGAVNVAHHFWEEVIPYPGNTTNAKLSWYYTTGTLATASEYQAPEIMNYYNYGLNVLGNTYGTENLTNGALTSGTSWAVANGFSLTANTAVYVHNASGGTLTQTAANFAVAVKANRWYRFTWTTSALNTTANCWIDPTGISAERVYLRGTVVTPGTYTTTFKTNAAPGDFILSANSAAASDGFTLDNLSLVEVTSGDVIANGKFTGGGTSGLAIDNVGDSTFDGNITLADAKNIILNTSTGTKIGTSTTQKIGFYNATPISQGASVADATGGATVDAEARTAINALISRIEALGLIATV